MSEKLNSAQTIIDEVFTPFLATLDARNEDTLRSIVAELRGAVIDGFQAYGDANDRLVDRVVPRLELEAESARAELVEERNSFTKLRNTLSSIGEGVKLEIDHATFSSRDDAQEFLDVVAEMDDRHLENEISEGEPPRDWIAELRVANIRLANAEAANPVLVKAWNDAKFETAMKTRRIAHLMDANNRYLERARSARNLLRSIHVAIQEALETKVIVDVFWMPGPTSETVVDAIGAELGQRISS